MSPRRLAPSFVVLLGVGCASPDLAALFPAGTPTRAEVAGGIPMNRYRDTVLGFEMLRPQGLEVVRLRARCTDTLPDPTEWSDGGSAAIFVALARVSFSVAANAQGIDSNSYSWESVGRGGQRSELATAAGPGWTLLSGERFVGVAMEGGGMATDLEDLKFATAERGDGCRLVMFFNAEAATLGDKITDWEMMESVRFTTARDKPETRTSLDSLPPSRRIGVVQSGDIYGGDCLAIDNAAVPLGTAITLFSFTDGLRSVGYGAIRRKVQGSCPDSAVAVLGASYASYSVGTERPRDDPVDFAIGVLGVARPDTTGNAIRIDVDGDGRPDRVGICSADKTASWAWVIAEQPRVRVLWKRRVEKVGIGVSRCSAALLDFLQ